MGEEIGVKTDNAKVKTLAACLNAANERFLDANKNPSRKVKEIDNRGSHFYLALYWAQALAVCEHAELKAEFAPIAKELADSESKIMDELIPCQGPKVDLGGYYRVDDAKTKPAMCPSGTLNAILAKMK